MTEFTLGWPHGYTTRDGRDVDILKTGIINECPIAAIVTARDGEQSTESYRQSGSFLGDEASCWDLINKPAPKRRIDGWLNIYPNGNSYLHKTRETADILGMHTRVACIEVDVEEGEGL